MDTKKRLMERNVAEEHSAGEMGGRCLHYIFSNSRTFQMSLAHWICHTLERRSPFDRVTTCCGSYGQLERNGNLLIII